MSNVSKRVRLIALTFALALAAAPAALAQGGTTGGGTTGGNTRTVASGQKMKIKGVVTSSPTASSCRTPTACRRPSR
jgi:hypothetical protein